jgi:NitT/TauT family transport system substrate-binding protein
MHKRRLGALLVATMVVAAACNTGGSSPSPSSAAPASQPPASEPVASAPAESVAPSAATAEKCTGQELRFILSFIPNVQHAGFLVASKRGYYEDEGLTVNIEPAGPNVDPVSAVGDGSAQLGQVDYGQLLRARAAGVPIKSIGQTYKDSFLLWFASKESGIASVADWKGKTVGQIQVGESPESDAMLAAAGLTPDDITETQQDFGIEDYTAGKVEVGTGVVFFHPASFNGQTDMKWPDDFNVFTPGENGAPIASQTIAVNEETLTSDPAALRCFLRASIRGWQATFANPEAAVDDVMTFIPEGAIPREHQAAAINDVLPIVGTGADDDLLKIDPAQYEESIRILQSVQYLEGDVTAADTFDASIYDTMGPVTAP